MVDKFQSGMPHHFKSNTILFIMQNRVKNKLQMYQAVRRVLQSNNEKWNGLTAFQNAVIQFSQKVTELESLTYKKSKALVGIKSTRDRKREEVTDMALRVSNCLYAYASHLLDEKLKAEVKYSPTKLKYAPIATFLQIVNGLINHANDHVEELEDYGINQEFIEDMTLTYMEFVEIANLPRQAVISRKVLSHNIKATISDIDDVLKDQLDKLIIIFTNDAPSFVFTYDSARTIIDRPATYRSRKEKNENSVDEKEFPTDQGDSSP